LEVGAAPFANMMEGMLDVHGNDAALA